MDKIMKVDMANPIFKLFKAVILIMFTFAFTIGLNELDTVEIDFIFIGVFLLIMEKTFSYLTKFKGIALLGAILVFAGILTDSANFTNIGAIVIAAPVVIDILVMSYSSIDTKKIGDNIKKVIDKCRGFVEKKEKK